MKSCQWFAGCPEPGTNPIRSGEPEPAWFCTPHWRQAVQAVMDAAARTIGDLRDPNYKQEKP